MKRAIVLVMGLVAIAGSSLGATRQFSGNPGGWDIAANWGGILPGSTGNDTAVIAAGDTCYVTNPVSPAYEVFTVIRGNSGDL